MSGFEIRSLKQWWEGGTNDSHRSVRRLPVIDIRESQNNGRHRLIVRDDLDFVVVHLPFSSLQSGERSFELPPRHIAFAILADESVLERCRDFFDATTSRATQQSRKPWLVQVILLANEALWCDAEELGIMQLAQDSTIADDGFRPLPRLWQPDPLIEAVLLPMLKHMYSESSSLHKEVWDLGSGAGRDVCFLAEQTRALGMNSYHFVGVDHHKASAKRCLPFWKNRGVDDRTETLLLDLSKISRVHEMIQDRKIVCLYAVRFWNQKLVHFLAKDAPLEKGTLFALSHFCKPNPGATWDFDHPKEKNVLDRHELRHLFQGTDRWEVIHDEMAPDGDHGRTLIQFVARRL